MTQTGFEALKEELRWQQQKSVHASLRPFQKRALRWQGLSGKRRVSFGQGSTRATSQGTRINELEDLAARAEVIDVSKLFRRQGQVRRNRGSGR